MGVSGDRNKSSLANRQPLREQPKRVHSRRMQRTATVTGTSSQPDGGAAKTGRTIQRAVIVSTGDELTTGRTSDTNSTFIAEHLVALGVDVVAVLVVGDFPDRLSWAWREAMRLGDLVVSTGGLGPTADDLTTETLADVVGRRLVLDENVALRIRQLFEAMGRTMPENNLKQAHFPAGAIIVPNPLGTAPGYRLEVTESRAVRHLVVLPGVPREMKRMMAEEVLPWLRTARGSSDVYLSHVFQTFGLSESALDELVAGAVGPGQGRVSFRAAFPQIAVRVTVHGPSDAAEARLESAAAQVRERLGTYCYGEGDTTMEEVVGHLLTEQGKTLAVAESCTGGLIGHRITNASGSSNYFLADFVTYSNAAKESVLGVNHSTLATHGAVSVEVAAEMAVGARRAATTTLGLASTGIAGPEGGTLEKPVGTVCLALATPERVFAQRYQLWGTRDWVKLLTSQLALEWVRRACLGFDPTASVSLRR
jgi:nicotinamide-nucleotide amidase